MKGLLAKREAILLAAFAGILALYFLIVTRLPHFGYVNELTASGGVWADADKLRDIIVVPLAVTVQLALLALLSALRFQPKRDFNRQLLFLLAVAGTLTFIWANGTPGIAAMTSIAVTMLLNRAAWKDEWHEVSGWMFVLAAAATIGVCNLSTASPLWTFFLLHPTFALCAILSGRRVVLLAGTLAVAGIGAVFVLCAPDFWRTPSDRFSILGALFVAIALIAFLQSAITVRRFWLAKPLASFPTPPPFALALTLSVATLARFQAESLPIDDYHFGEMLVGYKAFIDGNGWFRDFLSAHAFSDSLSGVLAYLAGDETGVGINIGSALLALLVMLAVQWRLAARLGPVGAILIGQVLLNHPSSQFPLLILMLVTDAGNCRRPWTAGALTATLGIGGIFLNGGPAVAAALAGGAGSLIIQARQNWRQPSRFLSAGVIASLSLLALLWPEMRGQIGFLKVSAETNLTIYGNGEFSILLKYPQNLIFAAGPVLAAIMAGLTGFWRQERSFRRAATLGMILCPITILALLLNSYAIGRLDDTGSRAFASSCILLAFLPFWLANLIKDPTINLPAVTICSLLLLAINYPLAPFLSGTPVLPPHRGVTAQPISASLPNLGDGRHDQAHVDRIETVSRTVDHVLKPGETFLDLTNRNGLYFYLKRPIPVPITSAYNAAPEAFQKKFLEALNSPPPLALVSIDNFEHDGISLPLRSHHIYDYLLVHYLPFVRDGYTYAIRQDLAERLNALPPLLATTEIWANAFHRPQLGRLPSAWGRSFSRLADAVQEEPAALQLHRVVGAKRISEAVDRYESESDRVQITLRLAGNINPRQIGLLSFSLTCESPDVFPVVEIYWKTEAGDFSREMSVSFQASHPANLVPLDSTPRWTLAETISEIRLDVINAAQCRTIKLKDVRLYRRMHADR